MIGQTLGSYSIQRELGRGGMGAVYVGIHGLLGRMAAVKVLLPELSRNQDIVQRFFNEARAATSIRHAGIVEIYDFGWAPDGSAYIVMEYLEGESLSTRLRRYGRLPAPAALGITRQIAGALAAAHRIGIVHRDLKPDNVYLVPDSEISGGERVKLLDFGIAKLAGDTSGGMARTSTGAIMGTPYYMSPEQCRGAGHVDHRSDLYSLGCMLFEMVCGRVPFLGEGAGEIIAAHIHVAAPQPRSLEPSLPAEVESLIVRLMAKNPAERIASADALSQEIAQLAAGAGASGAMAAAAPPPPTSSHPVQRAPSVAGPPPSIAQIPTVNTLGDAAGQSSTMPPRRSRTGLIVGAVAAAAVAAVLVIVLTRGDDAPTTAAATLDAAAGPLAIDAGSAAPVGGDFLKLLVEARAAVSERRWGDASKAADAALALDAANVEARELGERATRERDAAAAAATIEAARTGGDLSAAVAAFNRIPASSVYKAEATTRMDALRDAYFADITPKVEAHLEKKQCKDAAALVDAAQKLWPSATGALQKKVKACGKTDAEAKDTEAETPPEPELDEAAAAEAEQVVANAEAAAKTSQWARAMKLGEQALGMKPDGAVRVRALTVCALAACNLKNAGKAKQYVPKLPAARQNLVKQRCLANGIDVDY